MRTINLNNILKNEFIDFGVKKYFIKSNKCSKELICRNSALNGIGPINMILCMDCVKKIDYTVREPLMCSNFEEILTLQEAKDEAD